MALISKNSLLDYRVDLLREWTDANPILPPDTLGFVSGSNMYKVGDGKTKWNDLKFAYDNEDVYIVLSPILYGYEGVDYKVI